jgi:hypothetical protein
MGTAVGVTFEGADRFGGVEALSEPGVVLLRHALLVNRPVRAKSHLARATEVLASHAAKPNMTALTASTVRAVLSRHRGLTGPLQKIATPDERRCLYADLGITLSYERRTVQDRISELVRPFLVLPGAKSPPLLRITCVSVGGLEPPRPCGH